MPASTSRAKELFERIKENGTNEIRRLIDEQKAEEFFLDFKRSADSGSGRKLHQDDRKNLAKAISGFGNSEGGVIIWGVECSEKLSGIDGASAEHPIENVRRFVGQLNGAISGCTIPPHPLVENIALEIASSGNGFAVTLIPASDHAPHQTIQSLTYYMRAGSDFVRVPHGILSGMFGRRPQADLIDFWTIGFPKFIGNQLTFDVGYTLRNDGRGLAANAYITLKIFSPAGPTKIEVERLDGENWSGNFAFGAFFTLIAKSQFLIPPGGLVMPAGLNFSLAPPFTRPLKIESISGCESSEPKRTMRICSIKHLEESFAKAKLLESNGTLQSQAGQSVIERIFNVEHNE